VLGLDTNLMAEAKETGLFAPHQADISGLDVPIEWKDDTFVPFDWGWFAFVYDKTRLPAPPASMKDLVDNENGPKIIIQDPRTSTPGLGLLLWMKEIYGDGAADAWAKLRPRIVTVSKGWSEGYGLFVKGESDMVLSYTTSPAYHIGAEKDDKYAAAPFSEGHYLQVEVAGLVRSSDQQELGRSFLNFVLSEDFQSAIPETNWMYPAKTPASGLPDSFSTLVKPEKTLLKAPEEVAEHRRAWTDEWLDAMSR
jgi:thiamine transport system substrate-binding protein